MAYLAVVSIILLAAILVVLVESRITVGTRVAVMARDIEWITASLVKWGMLPPSGRQEQNKRDKDGK